MPKVAKETDLKYVLLGFLNHEPMSGYDLKKLIDFRISYFWKEVSYSQIYPTLKKLENKKLIKMNLERSENRPDKKVYMITSEGKKILHSWVSEPINIEQQIFGFDLFQEFLLKIYFGGITGKENNLENVQTLKIWLKNTLDIFNKFEKNLQPILKESPDHPQYYLAMLFGKSIYESVLKWTFEAEKILTG